MDLNNLLNNDQERNSRSQAPLSHPPPVRPSPERPVPRKVGSYHEQFRSPINPSPPNAFPPRPGYSDGRSYNATNQPYMTHQSPISTPASASHAHGQYPFPPPGTSQIPPVPHHSVPNGTRDERAPTTPGGAGPYHGPPVDVQWAHHSAHPPPHGQPGASPIQPHGYPPHSQGFRESPRSVSTVSHHSSHPHANQPSYPGTPLGPPANYPRNSFHGPREVASPSQARSYVPNPPSAHSGSPRVGYPTAPGGAIGGSPASRGHSQVPTLHPSDSYGSHSARERTESVSPKTQVRKVSQSSSHSGPAFNQLQPVAELHSTGLTRPPYPPHHSSRQSDGVQYTSNSGASPGSATYNPMAPPQTAHRPSSSRSLVVESSAPRMDTLNKSPSLHRSATDVDVVMRPTVNVQRSNSTDMSPRAPPIPEASPTYPPSMNQPGRQPSIDAQKSTVKRSADAMSESSPPAAAQPVKRQKYDTPPIWATRAPESAEIRRKIERGVPPRGRRHQARQPQPSPAPKQFNGQTARPQAKARPDWEETNDGPLGYWEASITNIIPFDELTRTVTDFMFANVVQTDDFGVADLGYPALPQGTVEVEAKLGTFIDKNTDERIRLPVATTTVLSDDFRSQIRFESNMSEHQHKSLNEFLNETLQKSHGPPPPGKPARVKMDYKHLYEVDSFYELSPAGHNMLPDAAKQIPTHNPPRLRITKDQRTGELLATIVKLRIADINIHSPNTAFDYRISVNLEVSMDGAGEEAAMPPEKARERRPDRFKDRLSYRHQAYQVDLTQVGASPKGGDRTHELEIEMDSAQIRRQGKLLLAGKPNEIERLVKVFLDNVKILARAAGAR